MLELDVSVFERNFIVFAQKDLNKTTFVSNCVRQLFRMKEKSVIIDTCNMFEDYKKIVFAKDFKLPLNSKMIEYIFDYELAEVDPSTKAVVQDIFYAVQQYIQTLDFEFLPIDNFVEVVANQYKETQMPELALLKNKLLKYKDANVFANTKDEVLALKEKLDEKNCSIIDLKDIHESLQKEVLSFIHSTLETYDKYIYFFVPLTDENSDKRLLKQFINHNRVFTTIMVSSSYKYANELKQHAQNMILFAPEDMNHDFSAYNTFLNKLNQDECIVYGKLTQGIPFIVEMSDLDLELTMEDVAGDKYQFVPVAENVQLVQVDEFGDKTPVDFDSQSQVQDNYEPEHQVQAAVDYEQEIDPAPIPQESVELMQEPQVMEVVEPVSPVVEQRFEDVVVPQQELVDVIQEPEIEEFSTIEAPETSEISEPSVIEPVANIFEEDTLSMDDSLDFDGFTAVDELDEISDLPQEDFVDEVVTPEYQQEEALTEADLNFMEENQMVQSDDLFSGEDIIEPEMYAQETPVVPVYPVEEPVNEASSGEFQRGDTVTHIRYGRGVIEKIIKYGNKNLCAITFENVGRRLLDPSISELTKLG